MKKIGFLCAVFIFFASSSFGANDDIFSSAEIGYGSGVVGNKPLVVASFGLREVPYVKFHMGVFRYTEGEKSIHKETKFVGADFVADAYSQERCPSWCPMNRLGLGISYFDNPTKNFGSKWEFHTIAKMGIRNERGDFYLLGGIDHWSTGGFTEKNDGETFFVFMAGYSF